MVGAFNMVYGADKAGLFYPCITVSCYAEDDETKLEMAVAQAVRDGNEAIVGGYSTVQIAERHWVPAVMIESGMRRLTMQYPKPLWQPISLPMKGCGRRKLPIL